MNRIGLEKSKVTPIIASLNGLLSSYMVFYQNVRGLHWNIKGEKFFVLHEKYEELYQNLQDKVDEIAERILTLESTPLHTFSDFEKSSEIKSLQNITDAREGVNEVLKSFEKLISSQREILKIAASAGDEGTVALMSDYIREQEKDMWMYAAFLGK